jgi:hypothetical protein
MPRMTSLRGLSWWWRPRMQATRTLATVASLRPAAALRQAWLNPAFAALYPDLPAGIWMTAVSASSLVVYATLRWGRPWPDDGPRVLSEAHFRFRGGRARGAEWNGVISRGTDP